MEFFDRCVEAESESNAGSSSSLRPIGIAATERVAVSEPQPKRVLWAATPSFTQFYFTGYCKCCHPVCHFLVSQFST